MAVGRIDSYLFFNGRAREAALFYGKIFGVTPTIMGMNEMPGMEGRGEEGQVAHADLRFDEGTGIMLSDGFSENFTVGNNFSMSWATGDEALFDRIWQAFLDNGSELEMPIDKTFWAEKFGSVIDPFGVSWMLMYSTPEQAAAVDFGLQNKADPQ